MTTTIVQVAKRAGVSAMTVSRVMHDQNAVKPKTLQKVLKAMQELSYVPSLAARAMRSKDKLCSNSSLCCAIIFGADVQSADCFFNDVARAAEHESASYGLSLLHSHWQASFEESWPRLQSIFSMEGLCGVILAGQFTKNEVQTIQNYTPNIVIMDGHAPPGVNIACVESDYAEGCRLALTHLLDRGARRLLHLTGEVGHYFSNAMCTGVETFRKNFERIDTIQTDLTAKTGYEIIHKIFSDGIAFDSVLANDELALGAIRAFNELSIRIPQQVKIIGFDDITHAEFSTPPLTTIRIDKSQLGREAVKSLVEMIRGGNKMAQIRKVLHASLVIRHSA